MFKNFPKEKLIIKHYRLPCFIRLHFEKIEKVWGWIPIAKLSIHFQNVYGEKN